MSAETEGAAIARSTSTLSETIELISKAMEGAGKELGRFGHHPDPAIDFCVEVESLESEWLNTKIGFGNGTPPVAEISRRADEAMSFRVGGDLNAIGAKSILRTIVSEISASERRSPVTTSVLDNIERALEGVKNSQWFMSPWHVEEDASAVRNQSDGSYICNASSDSFAAYLAACSPDRMREVLALARQAEALQRENADKDERLAILREALLGFEHACEQLAATRSHEIYTAMIDGGQAQELLELDNARRRARALLGGENAE